jgi:cysteine synthase
LDPILARRVRLDDIRLSLISQILLLDRIQKYIVQNLMQFFVSAVGSGGTLAGVSMGLKTKNKNIKITLADPMGAALYSYYTTGVLKSEGSSITEGIGQGRVTKNLEGAPIDTAYLIPDSEAVPIIFDLLENEGLCLGGSSGINVAATWVWTKSASNPPSWPSLRRARRATTSRGRSVFRLKTIRLPTLW